MVGPLEGFKVAKGTKERAWGRSNARTMNWRIWGLFWLQTNLSVAFYTSC